MTMAPPLLYELDLTKLQGEGDFKCPGCGITISPEDETDSVYVILGTKLSGDQLKELEIQCNRCKSKIRLSGFDAI